MEHYLLIARSVTQAQRMEQVLLGNGYRSRYFRAPAALSESGCSYAVTADSEGIDEIKFILDSAQLRPLRIYRRTESGWEAAGK